jgi:hypothetical protein
VRHLKVFCSVGKQVIIGVCSLVGRLFS